MLLNLFKALGFAILIWIIGFVWGSVVFMTPPLKATPAIPYVSANPAIRNRMKLKICGNGI